MKPFFSVIIPAYNVEDYLPRCLDSILSQSYCYFEILLINDGSTDSTPKICDEYSKKDNRIKTFHQKNSGVSTARNKGIENSQGIYLYFIDSDDWIEPNTFIELYNEVGNKKFDLIQFGFNRISKNNNKCFSPSNYKIIYNLDEYIKLDIYKHALWNYILKKEIIDKYNIRMLKDLNCSEDQNFLLKYLFVSNSFLIIDKSFYNYYIHPYSTTHKLITHHTANCQLIAAMDVLQFQSTLNKNSNLHETLILKLIEDYFIYLHNIPTSNYNKNTAIVTYTTFYNEAIKINNKIKNNKTLKTGLISIILSTLTIKINRFFLKTLTQ